MLVFFIHGVATRDACYSSNLQQLIKTEFSHREEKNPHFYAGFWGSALTDMGKIWNGIDEDLAAVKKKYPKIDTEEIFRYRPFREGLFSQFLGDFFTYMNLDKGREIRKTIAQQLYNFIKQNPDDSELHIVAHSLGTVILWDVLFSDRFSAKDPALSIRAMIRELENQTDVKLKHQVNLKSITIMGSPILLINMMLDVRPEKVNQLAHSYSSEQPLRWLNLIHASDLIAYPLKASLHLDENSYLKFEDEYLLEDVNLAEKTARSLGQNELAMVLGSSDAHKSYWNCPQTARLITNNILNQRKVIFQNLLKTVIHHLSQVKGMTPISDEVMGIKLNYHSKNIRKGDLYLQFPDKSGKIYLYINAINVHHVYVLDSDNELQFGGYVGWIDQEGLMEKLELIKGLMINR
ncbi:hypothetical protein PCC9214_04574 [Planktothrix tepida]|uniref:DUF676 domain-containing protein n=1 Tax=Planktothrix tepida PCC 9214 TaxID=671072 RepID=A0A1J1LNH6_9CYAN|nr:hypothetical protein [Planktothrix tepida]CAD5979900.1 hypothetical protein PCC9214_04574 [Planktothrix tepida]CUR33546.1 conserved hypothetical protein [Planktothrix tepida PCC 9214]